MNHTTKNPAPGANREQGHNTERESHPMPYEASIVGRRSEEGKTHEHPFP
jgi:hypothetical protein